MEITGYKCSCGVGTINKTIEKLPNGTNKIGVYPCNNCGNHPHLFALKNYKNVGTIKQKNSMNEKLISNSINIMIAKQKALELYNKYRDMAPVLEANIRSKKNALIAIDEIISTLKSLGEELYDKQGTDSYNARCLNHDKKQFWKDVKQEIEKI